MEETESLSDIIQSPFAAGEKAAEATPEPPSGEVKEIKTDEPAEAKREQARDESGRFVKKEEKAEEPPKDEGKAEPEIKEDGRNAALKAARERYRIAEARLRELEAQQKEQKVSIFEDEEKGIAQRIVEQSKPLREATFNMSVKLARLTYKDDYDRAEAAFLESAEADPRLYEQLRASADPGEFIYTIGTQIAELAPVGGNFAKYREKVTAELKQEIAKRDDALKAKDAEIDRLKKQMAELEAIPRSLNKGNDVAPRSTAEADDDDISSIVRFGK